MPFQRPPDATWKPLREPTPWVMQLFALPVGTIACAVVAILWYFLAPLRDLSFDGVVMMPITFAILIPVHELIHAAVHPRSGLSSDSILGFWPSRILFYAHYHGELSRERFIAILLMPLLIISFVPLFACAAVGHSTAVLAFASAVNALSACGDILGVGLLLFQVPAGATVRNQGWRTFWKIDDVKAR